MNPIELSEQPILELLAKESSAGYALQRRVTRAFPLHKHQAIIVALMVLTNKPYWDIVEMLKPIDEAIKQVEDARVAKKRPVQASAGFGR